ncbi:MAG: hypothetical protein Q3979_00815 [Actinomycetaceae bacterium]|nr:hypothetical protein [Actinomycetaceae bacterium]
MSQLAVELSKLRAGLHLRGMVPGQVVTVVAVDPIDDGLVEVFCRDESAALAAIMSVQGADAVAQLLAEARDHVNLDAVKELGFLPFHEAEKKNQAKDALLSNGLVSAWGDVMERARRIDPGVRVAQTAFDFKGDV